VKSNAGRNHYPKAFSCLMAGGGITGGQTHGNTDENGAEVLSPKTSAQDFNSTIAYAMGIPHDKVVNSPSNRPFRMGGINGKPITSLFS